MKVLLFVKLQSLIVWFHFVHSRVATCPRKLRAREATCCESGWECPEIILNKIKMSLKLDHFFKNAKGRGVHSGTSFWAQIGSLALSKYFNKENDLNIINITLIVTISFTGKIISFDNHLEKSVTLTQNHFHLWSLKGSLHFKSVFYTLLFSLACSFYKKLEIC